MHHTKMSLQIQVLFFSLALFLFIACKSDIHTSSPQSSPSQEEDVQAEEKAAGQLSFITSATEFGKDNSILLTFAGDLMAHTPNWSKGQFDRIYKDISPLLLSSDAAFANMETPVADTLPYSSYPNFNVHKEYAQAAIDAGFNVFSLANNHTNDQFLDGIKQTKAYFDKKREETKNSARPVWAAGLKDKSNGELSYQVVEANGWKILFVAMTEILNTPSYASYIDYYYPSQKNREKFIEDIKKLKQEHPHDLFVCSIHCAEPEYVFTLAKGQKEFYYDVLDAGADVIWVNHPHVSKGWEVIQDSQNIPKKIIFYSMGNSISAQRTNPSFSNPSLTRDYTGDGYMAQVRFVRTDTGINIAQVSPIVITTYIEPDKMYVIKILNENFIKELTEQNHLIWAKYLTERKRLMEQIQGKLIWQ